MDPLKLTYNITGLTMKDVRFIEAANEMAAALQQFLAWNDQPAALPPDGSRTECADVARAALKKAGVL
jgi:hypothetical protein